MVFSVREIEDEYISKNCWLVSENANSNVSASSLYFYISRRIVCESALSEIIGKNIPEGLKLHYEGYIHIHKILDGGLWLPYCCGVSTFRILLKGLKTPNVVSRPPRHLDSAVDQLANFIMIMAQERTGAVGLDALDLYLAPFVRHDRIDYRHVRQCIQRFFYNLNYTTRIGYQTPFSNITIALGVKEYHNQPAIVGGKIVGRLGEYLDEAKLVLKAICEILLEGDAYGRPFTFPIPTIIVTREFFKYLEEDTELSELFWKVVAERGSFYFLNSLNTDRTGMFSFCCRLTADRKKVVEYLHLTKGTWVLVPSTGSINYVSINLPRLGIEALKKGDVENYLYEKLYDLMNVSRRILNFLRRRYMEFFRLGLYPLTREYIDNINPFKYYFNTISVVGLAELASIIIGDPRLWYREISLNGSDYVSEIVKVYRGILTYINNVLSEFESEDNVLYNLEQAPAESSSYRFALLDYEKYPEYREYIPTEVDPYTGKREPFYTSQNTPPYTTYRLSTQIHIESETQKLFTGGVIKHIFVHRPIEPTKVKELIQEVLNTDIVYVSYTPTQSICLDCGYRTTQTIWNCPKCGSNNIEQWTRIVGYYRPLRQFNPGRRAEFKARVSLL